MSDSGIGNLTNDEMYDAIRQGVVEALEPLIPSFSVQDAIKDGVFDAFAGLLVNSIRDDPRADLLLSVERGVQEAFEKIGTTADAPKRSKPYIDDGTAEPEGAPE